MDLNKCKSSKNGNSEPAAKLTLISIFVLVSEQVLRVVFILTIFTDLGIYS
jgi:hypothetical protein